MPHKLLNNREAAEYLGVAEKTTAKWRCHGGGPPYIKIGGAIRYEQAELDRYIEKCRRHNTSQHEKV